MPDSVIRILKNEKFTLTNPYEACTKGKFIASPNHNAAETHYTEFGSHMSSDLFGPVAINSYKDVKYLFTLLDITTRWLNFRLLNTKTKSEALAAFKDIKTATENQSSKKIKILHTDWDKEFINIDFNAYLTQCRILYEKSAPYTYKQNGLAERINQTILEKTRYLLFQSGLSIKYWLLAVEAAIYIYN